MTLFELEVVLIVIEVGVTVMAGVVGDKGAYVSDRRLTLGGSPFGSGSTL